MNIYEKLKELNLEIPAAPPKGGVYAPCQEFGNNLVYISGCGPVIGGEGISGKLGNEFTTEEGKTFSRNAMLNVLAVLQDKIGDLNRIKRAVKILTFELLLQLLGQENVPARSAIGVNVLPGNIPVETEAIFEIE